MSTSRDIAGVLNNRAGLVPLELAEDQKFAFDPPVSEAQRKAMWAAKSGHSTLGIPQKVGAEFAKADPGGKLPKAKDEEPKKESERIRFASTEAKTPAQRRREAAEAKAAKKAKDGRWGGRAAHDAWTDSVLDKMEKEKENMADTEPTKVENVEKTGRWGGRASPHVAVPTPRSLDGIHAHSL
jgi:hypothetical protein